MSILWFVFRACMILVFINIVIKKYGPNSWFDISSPRRPLLVDAPIIIRYIDNMSEPAFVIFVISGFFIYISAL